MLFESIPHEKNLDRTPRITLRHVRWDDHGFRTWFTATYHGEHDQVIEVGDLKILHKSQRKTELPAEFEVLPDAYISLGQSEQYYRAIDELGAVGQSILHGLRDLTHPSMHGFDPSTFGDGYHQSLVRFPEAYRAYAERTGHSMPSKLSFRYQYRFASFGNHHQIDFHFDSRAPLGRINVLVGENASGKTAVLSRLAFALSGTPAKGEISEPNLQLAPILAISFSAFDQFERPDHSNPRYDYSGLRIHEAHGNGKVDIDRAFSLLDDRVEDIRRAGRLDSWCRSLDTCGVSLEFPHDARVSSKMKMLSSGQKFAVFVFTNLVAKIRSRSMILFDEPELHTHPRMLTGIMRALIELLTEHDSYAILATHSPIVLQEVPARAIRIVERFEGHARISSYPTESFGAPLDQLVREAFHLERTERNFVHRIEDMARREGTSAVESLESVLSEDIPLSTQALLERFKAQA